MSGNYAGSDGGGVIADTVNVIRSTVSNNSAGSDGGGIDASDMTLDRSTVSGNFASTATAGASTQTATMINSTVSGNTAVNGSGGGVAFVISGDATIRSCTVVENTALVDGGGDPGDPAATNPTRMTNTIVALDSAAGIGRDVSGDIASFGSNLIGDSTGSTGFDDITDFFGSSAAPLDPLIGPLANNGGLTKTHALLPGSFAIDRGNDANVPAGTHDGAGFPRQKPGTALGFPRIDIGAFEL